MEYEFYQDFIDGSPKAKFSYGHEVIGFWLEQEIGTNVSKLSALIQQLQQMINDRYGQLQLSGREFSLDADFQDATILANSHLQAGIVTEGRHVDLEEGDAEPFEQQEFDENPMFVEAECGSPDLVHMLMLWQEFLS
ncbi:UPF0231 family protein [Thalassotalea litorea]|uniref:UPF0231 family protein n=1 Tax=Thalassotalea litorea TaxID=2020715 RepID=A0A5R9IUB0_9GAMM|nr:YacL family protein [Thalassotalea litorea]TLU66756.1 UPF0231 family protein [Thalassotalea litorea]